MSAPSADTPGCLRDSTSSDALPRAVSRGANEGWVFPSKGSRSGYITNREVSKQWLEAKRLAGIPESVVLYCACHRFSTDAMEGTGNVLAVMDAMGHGSVNSTRIYKHTNAGLIREAIERRNKLSTAPVQGVGKPATSDHSPINAWFQGFT